MDAELILTVSLFLVDGEIGYTVHNHEGEGAALDVTDQYDLSNVETGDDRGGFALLKKGKVDGSIESDGEG